MSANGKQWAKIPHQISVLDTMNRKVQAALPASVNLPLTKEAREGCTVQSGLVFIYKSSVNFAVLQFCSKVQNIFNGFFY